jgi:hypothetical protein
MDTDLIVSISACVWKWTTSGAEFRVSVENVQKICRIPPTCPWCLSKDQVHALLACFDNKQYIANPNPIQQIHQILKNAWGLRDHVPFPSLCLFQLVRVTIAEHPRMGQAIRLGKQAMNRIACRAPVAQFQNGNWHH